MQISKSVSITETFSSCCQCPYQKGGKCTHYDYPKGSPSNSNEMEYPIEIIEQDCDITNEFPESCPIPDNDHTEQMLKELENLGAEDYICLCGIKGGCC